MEILIESDVGLGQESLKLLKDTNQQQIPTERGVKRGKIRFILFCENMLHLKGIPFVFAIGFSLPLPCRRPSIARSYALWR